MALRAIDATTQRSRKEMEISLYSQKVMLMNFRSRSSSSRQRMACMDLIHGDRIEAACSNKVCAPLWFLSGLCSQCRDKILRNMRPLPFNKWCAERSWKRKVLNAELQRHKSEDATLAALLEPHAKRRKSGARYLNGVRTHRS
eukprot:4427924-Amphidinium_carterae.1